MWQTPSRDSPNAPRAKKQSAKPSTPVPGGVTIGELAALIIRQVNPDATIICEKERVRPDKSEVMQLICDNRCAKDLAGWKPHYSLEEGLSLTIEWMKVHISSYKAGLYTV